MRGGGGPQDFLGDSISLPVHPGQPQHRRPAPILHVTAGTGARPQRALARGTDASVPRERQGGVDEDRLGGASSGRGLGSVELEPRRLPRSFLSGLELCTNLPLLLALEGGAGAPGGAPRSTPTPTRGGGRPRSGPGARAGGCAAAAPTSKACGRVGVRGAGSCSWRRRRLTDTQRVSISVSRCLQTREI